MSATPPAGLVTVRCPACGRPTPWRANAARPFCSIACKLVDLGGWLDERYRVPGAALGPRERSGATDPTAEDA